MIKSLSFFTLIFIAFSGSVYADIYKHVDADGRITYSNIKSKDAIRLEFDPDANVISNNNKKSSSASKPSPTPSNFPNVDKQTQASRDDKRAEILKSELESEKTALETAKKAYDDGAANPEVFHKKNADGSTSTFRNVSKYNEKVKTLQADVDSHENNIKLLQKELDALH